MRHVTRGGSEALICHHLPEPRLERVEQLLGNAGDVGELVGVVLFFHAPPPLFPPAAAALSARARDLSRVAADGRAASRARAPAAARILLQRALLL
jgi:hypothetical protein